MFLLFDDLCSFVVFFCILSYILNFGKPVFYFFLSFFPVIISGFKDVKSAHPKPKHEDECCAVDRCLDKLGKISGIRLVSETEVAVTSSNKRCVYFCCCVMAVHLYVWQFLFRLHALCDAQQTSALDVQVNQGPYISYIFNNRVVYIG